MPTKTPKEPMSVFFYRTDTGCEPVRDWLHGLSAEDRKSIGEDIKTAQLGWPIGMPLIEKIEPGIWEVRSRIRHGIARVLITIQGDEIVLLHGFIKKSQKITKEDLLLARQRLAKVRR